MFLWLFLVTLTILLVYVGKTKALYKRFKGVLDKDAELARIQTLVDEAENHFEEAENRFEDVKKQHQLLVQEITDRSAYLEELEGAIAVIETGIYEAEYDFDTAEKYKAEIDRIISKEKEMIKEKKAMLLRDEDASKEEKTRRRDQMKLMLRVFNNDCDSIMKRVKWNNFDQMKKKIETSFNTANKLGESSNIRISGHYKNWKVKELHLVYEYQETRSVQVSSASLLPLPEHLPQPDCKAVLRPGAHHLRRIPPKPNAPIHGST